jgi:hypothetical protein
VKGERFEPGLAMVGKFCIELHGIYSRKTWGEQERDASLCVFPTILLIYGNDVLNQAELFTL